MPRRKPDEDDLRKRELLAKEMKDFREKFIFNQKKLAEILEVSRRTVQMIEAGLVTPHPGTLRKWKALTTKYRANN